MAEEHHYRAVVVESSMAFGLINRITVQQRWVDLKKPLEPPRSSFSLLTRKLSQSTTSDASLVTSSMLGKTLISA